jgi:hypothetical protein
MVHLWRLYRLCRNSGAIVMQQCRLCRLYRLYRNSGAIVVQ